MRGLRLLPFLLVCLLSAQTASAVAIQYTFTSVNYSNNYPYPNSTIIETFQYTAPTFISTDGVADAPSLNYCSITGMMVNAPVIAPTPCASVTFWQSGTGEQYPAILVAEYWWIPGCCSGGGAGANYFPVGCFSSVGEYDAIGNNDHYTAHLSVQAVATPDVAVDPLTQSLQNFQSFTATQDIGPNDFQVNGLLTFGPSGLNPVTSPVALRLGSFFGSIPAGSFVQNDKGDFVYEGIVNGVTLQITIEPVAKYNYTLTIEGQGVSLGGGSVPLYLALLIGDVSGAAVGPPPLVTVTSSVNPSYLDQMVTFTATVASQVGAAATGSVTFKQGKTALATIALSNSQAAYSIPFTSTGKYLITAVYSGDTNNLASTSATLKQSVEHLPAATTTKLATSGSPTFVNQTVTFTSTTTSTDGSIPDGEIVTFFDGTTKIGTGITANGLAAFSTSSLTAKTHSIKATYAGDATFKTSSGTVKQVVTFDQSIHR